MSALVDRILALLRGVHLTGDEAEQIIEVVRARVRRVA